MKKFYYKLSKTKKIIFLVSTILLSVPLGGIAGLMFGLMMTTFIPMCDNGTGGGHNCFNIGGLVGYEATGVIGLCAGMIFVPLMYIYFIIRMELKK